MVEQKPNLTFLGIFPKCPFYNSAPAVLIILALIALGTVGIYFLNGWLAVGYLIYSMVFYFFVMPLTMCKYCYYQVKDTTTDNKTGTTMEKLLPVDKWSESYLKKHVGQKNWTVFMSIIWLLPIVLIIISFFLSFEN